MPELWERIFNQGQPIEFQGVSIFFAFSEPGQLQAASKWTCQLFWTYRTTYDFSEPGLVKKIMARANPCMVQKVLLRGEKIGDADVLALISLGLQRLRHLSLEDSCITNDVMGNITRSFSTLRELSLRGCRALTDTGLEQLTSLGRLEILLMAKCKRFTEESHRFLGQLSRLQHVELSSNSKLLLSRDRVPAIFLRILP